MHVRALSSSDVYTLLRTACRLQHPRAEDYVGKYVMRLAP